MTDLKKITILPENEMIFLIPHLFEIFHSFAVYVDYNRMQKTGFENEVSFAELQNSQIWKLKHRKMQLERFADP